MLGNCPALQHPPLSTSVVPPDFLTACLAPELKPYAALLSTMPFPFGILFLPLLNCLFLLSDATLVAAHLPLVSSAYSLYPFFICILSCPSHGFSLSFGAPTLLLLSDSLSFSPFILVILTIGCSTYNNKNNKNLQINGKLNWTLNIAFHGQLLGTNSMGARTSTG